MILLHTILFVYTFITTSFSMGMLIFKRSDISGNMRIVEGRDAKAGEFPYQACLGEMHNGDFTHFCGGVLVDKCHILTAAHCVDDFKDNFDHVHIMLGDIDLQGKNANRQETEVKQMFFHKEYNYTIIKGTNDIAMIRTKTNLIENDDVRPIALRSEAITEGQCVATGWGALKPKSRKETDFNSTILQAIEIPLIKEEVCKKLFEGSSDGQILPGMICAGQTEEGKDICILDSGGPLICDGQLTGIISWGDCGISKLPGVYVDIVHYIDWIHDTIDKNKCDDSTA